MTVYYTVFVITLILAKLLPDRNRKEYLWKVIITLLPLFLFGALRVDFGLDYATYEAEYMALHSGVHIGVNKHSEIGFQYLLQILPTWRCVVGCTALVLCIAWGVLLYRNVGRNYLYIAIFLMFCIGNYTVYTPLVAMRNGLTISIMMLSFPLIEQRKYLLVLAIAFLGHYIHSSIMLFMPIALLVGRNNELTTREIKIWLVVILILMLLSASTLVTIVAPYVLDKFERYEYVFDIMSKSQHDSWLVNIANIALLSVVLVQFYKHRAELTKSENSYFRIGMIYLLCGFLGTLGSARTQAYFLPFFILILVKLYSMKWKDQVAKLIFFLFVVAYFLYRFFYIWQWNNPYFVFEDYESVIGNF